MKINFNDWDNYEESIDYPQHVDKKIYKRFIKFLNDNNIYDEYFDRLSKVGEYYDNDSYNGENFFFDIEEYEWIYKVSWSGNFFKRLRYFLQKEDEISKIIKNKFVKYLDKL